MTSPYQQPPQSQQDGFHAAPSNPNLPPVRPTPDHPRWPLEGEPGVEAFRERMRESMAALAWDPGTGKHYISIPFSLIEKDRVNGRIVMLIQQYRPDLEWDVRAEEFSLKTFR